MKERPFYGILTKEEILKFIKADPPLIEDYIDLKIQVQPAGFELTLQKIEEFKTPGSIDFSNETRILSKGRLIPFVNDWVLLEPGSYKVTFNEIISLPTNLLAIAQPRSSLLRCGVTVETAVWDPGYRGRSESLLIIYNRKGFKIRKNARLLQLLFIKLENSLSEGYKGQFMFENI